ncbi:hypothetical protein PF008_g18930 [Phytophthora fragariae]|uniref:Uncharacterized protein n=1 Tax=Phytophthora fragariae TaxID=53985 RepID=A0A6G0R4N7_9STRA|nr:hypothetical protein PF008_g18930 [Phytophthora fragariae]
MRWRIFTALCFATSHLRMQMMTTVAMMIRYLRISTTTTTEKSDKLCSFIWTASKSRQISVVLYIGSILSISDWLTPAS